MRRLGFVFAHSQGPELRIIHHAYKSSEFLLFQDRWLVKSSFVGAIRTKNHQNFKKYISISTYIAQRIKHILTLKINAKRYFKEVDIFLFGNDICRSISMICP
jgi:hypothetical protein